MEVGMTDSDHAIHEAVKKRYGSIAKGFVDGNITDQLRSSAATVDTNDCCSPVLYDAQLLDGLPVDVTGLSLGCGDPVTIADLRPGETVVDLGSGGGIDCFLAARQVGATGHVIGVDMTPEMLAKANANKAKLNVANVEFRQGQIEALPVDDSSVDVVMSNCVINLSPDKRAVFGEIFRVLKPGGRVSFSDIVTEGEFSPEMRERLDQWSECDTGAINADDYVSMLRDASFASIQIVDKVSAEDIVQRRVGMPRLFSARIIAKKPG
jgi:arsenite methyltransferase